MLDNHPATQNVTLLQKKPLKVKEVFEFSRAVRTGTIPIVDGIKDLSDGQKAILDFLRSNRENPHPALMAEQKAPIINAKVDVNGLLKPSAKATVRGEKLKDKAIPVTPAPFIISKTEKNSLPLGIKEAARAETRITPVTQPDTVKAKPTDPVLNPTVKAKEGKETSNPQKKAVAEQRRQNKTAKVIGDAVSDANRQSAREQEAKNKKRDSIILKNQSGFSSATDIAGSALLGPIFQAFREGAELLHVDSFAGKLAGKADKRFGISEKANHIVGTAEEKTGYKRFHNWLNDIESEESKEENSRLEKLARSDDGKFRNDKGEYITKAEAITAQKKKEVVQQLKYKPLHNEDSLSKIDQKFLKKKVRIETREQARVIRGENVLQPKPRTDIPPQFANQDEVQDLLMEISYNLKKNEREQRKRDKKRDKRLLGIGSEGGFQLSDLIPGSRNRKGSIRRKGANAFRETKVGRGAAKVGNLAKRGGSLALKGSGAALRGGGTLLKGGIKAAGRFASKIPIIGALATAGMAVWDFSEGMDKAAEITGKSKKNLTKWDKGLAGTASAISGVTFGLLSTETVFKGLNAASTALSNGFTWAKDKVSELSSTIGDAISAIGDKIEKSLAETANMDSEDMTTGDKVQALFSKGISGLLGGIVESKKIYKDIENFRHVALGEKKKNYSPPPTISKSIIEPVSTSQPKMLNGVTPPTFQTPMLKPIKKPEPTGVERVNKAVEKLRETQKTTEKIIERNNNTVHEKLKPVFTDADRIPKPLHHGSDVQALWLQGKI